MNATTTVALMITGKATRVADAKTFDATFGVMLTPAEAADYAAIYGTVEGIPEYPASTPPSSKFPDHIRMVGSPGCYRRSPFVGVAAH